MAEDSGTDPRRAAIRTIVGYDWDANDAAWDSMTEDLITGIDAADHAAGWVRVRADDAAEEPSDVGPYPIGSPEFHIWQDGHRNGYKSERRMWQSFTGCKYPQDVAGRAAADRAAGFIRVRADDATVERVARELYRNAHMGGIAYENERWRQHEDEARAVLAALLEDQ